MIFVCLSSLYLLSWSQISIAFYFLHDMLPDLCSSNHPSMHTLIFTNNSNSFSSIYTKTPVLQRDLSATTQYTLYSLCVSSANLLQSLDTSSSYLSPLQAEMSSLLFWAVQLCMISLFSEFDFVLTPWTTVWNYSMITVLHQRLFLDSLLTENYF